MFVKPLKTSKELGLEPLDIAAAGTNGGNDKGKCTWHSIWMTAVSGKSSGKRGRNFCSPKTYTSGMRKAHGTVTAAPQIVSALSSSADTYPTGRIQIKQGKGIKILVTAAASPQGANTPVSSTSTHVGRRTQGKKAKGTTKSATVTAALQGASMSLSATLVRYPFERDTGSHSRRGNNMLNSLSLPLQLGCNHNIGSTVLDLIQTLVGDIYIYEMTKYDLASSQGIIARTNQ